MPLRDHFRPPLSRSRHWENLHSAWANAVRDHLNAELLPADYFAEVQISQGDRVEIDVATFDEGIRGVGNGGVAVWAPPKPFTAPLDFSHPDLFEVQIYRDDGGPRLVAAVEFVSPRNKDRPAARHAFAVKCASYLHSGVAVAIVDVVTSRTGNLHQLLLQLLNIEADSSGLASAALYATAYRTAINESKPELEYWGEALAIGQALPTLPLWIGSDMSLPLDLESPYERACETSRIGN